jgi:hypothetical protein
MEMTVRKEEEETSIFDITTKEMKKVPLSGSCLDFIFLTGNAL